VCEDNSHILGSDEDFLFFDHNSHSSGSMSNEDDIEKMSFKDMFFKYYSQLNYNESKFKKILKIKSFNILLYNNKHCGSLSNKSDDDADDDEEEEEIEEIINVDYWESVMKIGKYSKDAEQYTSSLSDLISKIKLHSFLILLFEDIFFCPNLTYVGSKTVSDKKSQNSVSGSSAVFIPFLGEVSGYQISGNIGNILLRISSEGIKEIKSYLKIVESIPERKTDENNSKDDDDDDDDDDGLNFNPVKLENSENEDDFF
jgi:hypothetical protein